MHMSLQQESKCLDNHEICTKQVHYTTHTAAAASRYKLTLFYMQNIAISGVFYDTPNDTYRVRGQIPLADCTE